MVLLAVGGWLFVTLARTIKLCIDNRLFVCLCSQSLSVMQCEAKLLETRGLVFRLCCLVITAHAFFR